MAKANESRSNAIYRGIEKLFETRGFLVMITPSVAVLGNELRPSRIPGNDFTCQRHLS